MVLPSGRDWPGCHGHHCLFLEIALQLSVRYVYIRATRKCDTPVCSDGSQSLPLSSALSLHFGQRIWRISTGAYHRRILTHHIGNSILYVRVFMLGVCNLCEVDPDQGYLLCTCYTCAISTTLKRSAHIPCSSLLCGMTWAQKVTPFKFQTFASQSPCAVLAKSLRSYRRQAEIFLTQGV